MTAALDNDASEFVAPRPRATGTPSPEALGRLQAAVSKSPSHQQRPMAQHAPQPAARQAAAAEAPRPRFGIGSLINRMAGHGEGPAERHAGQPQVARQQPPVNAYDDEPEMNADQERIEIPAFLRRQAN
jgi:cell division protein FtsZ